MPVESKLQWRLEFDREAENLDGKGDELCNDYSHKKFHKDIDA